MVDDDQEQRAQTFDQKSRGQLLLEQMQANQIKLAEISRAIGEGLSAVRSTGGIPDTQSFEHHAASERGSFSDFFGALEHMLKGYDAIAEDLKFRADELKRCF